MALLTRLGPRDAEAIARHYGLGEGAALVPVPKGSVNSNFFLDTTRGRFFLRVFEEQGPEGARYETRLLAHLAAHGVSTPAPLATTAGEPFGVHLGKPIAVFPAVVGHELCQGLVTPDAARQVGEALGRVHVAAARFPERRRGRFEPEDLLRRLQGVSAGDLPDTPDVLARARRELAQPLPNLPLGPIHGDLFRDNVLWREGRLVALLDFESAADGLYTYDLAVTLLAWTFGARFEPALVRAMVAGYETVRPLAPDERAAVPRLCERAACRFVVTRITDYHLRSLRAPGSVIVKDYRRFVDRWDRIDTELARALMSSAGGADP